METISPSDVHILIVDDDPLSLMVMERMLKRCQYKVTSCNRVAAALVKLRENTSAYNLVISDVYMPEDNGFALLEVVALEMDLPVIMMSANGETSVVMKGITHGACDYLIKPIRLEELKTLWQHVARRKSSNSSSSNNKEEEEETKEADAVDPIVIDVADDDRDTGNDGREALRWSAALHERFVSAVNELGTENTSPEKVLRLMNEPGLTVDQISSHMHKYKLTLSRLNEESGQGSPETVMENNRKAKSKSKPKSTKKPTHGT